MNICMLRFEILLLVNGMFGVVECDTMQCSGQISEFQRLILHASSGYKKGCSAMKIEASGSFEMLVHTCLITRHHIAGNHKLNK